MTESGPIPLDPISVLSRDLRKAAITLSDMEARFLVDAYYLMQGQRIRAGNQLRAMAEEPHAVLAWLGEQSERLENQVKGALDAYTQGHPVGPWLRAVKGIGPVISAGLLAHIDIRQAPTVGHIWRFAGLDPTSRWEKGGCLFDHPHDSLPCVIHDCAYEFANNRDDLSDHHHRFHCGPFSTTCGTIITQSETLPCAYWLPIPLVNRMSDADFEQARAALRDRYGDNRAEAGNRYEQELAKLFWRSGWTQEELAAKEGKTQAWISYRLVFGRFLTFITTVINDENLPKTLSERRFRDFWSQTDKDDNERERFTAVAVRAHVHVAVKQFLADLHGEMYRKILGSEPPLPYPIAILGHAHHRR